MKIFVTRHGRTEWNAQNRVSGITDISLTAKGIEQARRLATEIANYRIDLIISSPLTRARTTADILAEAIGKRYCG